jgi:integrase
MRPGTYSPRPTGQKAPFTPTEIAKLRAILPPRDAALFGVGVDSMLRSGDLLALKVSHVLDDNGAVRERLTVRQGKVSGMACHAVTVHLTPPTRQAVQALVKGECKHPSDYLFTRPGSPHAAKPLCRMQLRRRVKLWAAMLGRDSAAFAGHSLRRSKATELYRRTRDLEACRRLLGHKWITSTQSYIAGPNASEEALSLAAALDF